MRTRGRTLGENHPCTLMSMENHARTLKETGDDTAASQLMRACATAPSEVLGIRRPHTAASLTTRMGQTRVKRAPSLVWDMTKS